MSERSGRSVDRAATDFVVEIYDTEGGPVRAISRLLDLSAEGACVESTSELMEGDKIFIRLLLDNRHLLSLPAEILWSRFYSKTYHYGLRFGLYPESSRQLLENFVTDYALAWRSKT